METKTTWENLSASNPKPTIAYSLPTSNSAISHIQSHELTAEVPLNPGETHIYVCFTTYDCELIVMRNCSQTGKINRDFPSFEQVLRVRTHQPIVQSLMYYHMKQPYNEQRLWGMFADCFGNIYSADLSSHQQQFKKYGIKQPLLYSTVYANTSINVSSPQQLYLEHPLVLAAASKEIVITVSLKGELRLIDTSQQQPRQRERIRLSLSGQGLAAAWGKHNEDYYLITAVNNKRIPYVWTNCSSSDVQRCLVSQQQYIRQWQQSSDQIIYCTFDQDTATVVTALLNKEIEVFHIKRINAAEGPFSICQRRFRFCIDFSPQKNSPEMFILWVQAARGGCVIATCKEYIFFNLKTRKIDKRGKSSSLDRLKWVLIMDNQASIYTIILIRGYNHHNQAQSKLGKPNVHFKAIETDPKRPS